MVQCWSIKVEDLLETRYSVDFSVLLKFVKQHKNRVQPNKRLEMQSITVGRGSRVQETDMELNLVIRIPGMIF